MADRTVTVTIKAVVRDYESGLAGAAAATKAFESSVDGASVKTKTSFSGMSKSATDFERVLSSSLKDGETGFKSIQLAIDDTKKRITGLQKQILTTPGNTSLFGDLKSAQKDLRTLEGIFKSIGGDAAKEGQNAAQQFMSNFGAIGSALATPQGAAIAAGIVAVAVPVVGAALAGAITGGVGLGVIGAAALIQKDNPVIQQAFGGLKDTAISVFTDASQPLVQPFADALASLSKVVQQDGPQFKAIFTAVSPAVALIAKDLGALVTNTLPGIESVAKAFSTSFADPAVQHSIVAVTNQFNTLFETIGHNPQLIADAFHVLNNILDATLVTLTAFVRVAGFLDKFWHSQPQILNQVATSTAKVGTSAQQAIIPMTALANTQKDGAVAVNNLANAQAKQGVTAAALTKTQKDGLLTVGNLADAHEKQAVATQHVALTQRQLNDAIINGNGPTIALAEAVKPLNEQIFQAGYDANTAARAYNDLATAMDTSANAALTAAGNELALKQAQADLTSSIKANGKTFDENTQKGRNNMQALLGVLNANRSNIDGQIQAGTATEKATKQYIANTNAAINQAEANHGNVKQLEELRQKLLDLPPQKTLKVNVQVHVAESPQAAQLLSQHTFQATTNRYGGIYEHAADGALRQAQTFSSVANGARYAFAEPATGGEAFIPRLGDYTRSLGILSTAAAWYGARLVSGRGGMAGVSGGTPVTYHSEMNVYPQKANFGPGDLAHLQRLQEVTQRVGRPGAH